MRGEESSSADGTVEAVAASAASVAIVLSKGKCEGLPIIVVVMLSSLRERERVRVSE